MRAATIFSLLFALSFPAHAQMSTPATMEVVGSATFTGPVGYALHDRLKVRIRDAQGRPWPGLNVTFLVNTGAYFGGQQPPYAKYGVFLTGDQPPSTESHRVLTDADGVATSLPYLVAYESMGAIASASSGSYGNPPLGTQHLGVSFDITRGVGTGSVPLPAFSIPALLALIGGLVVLVFAFQRQRSPSRA